MSIRGNASFAVPRRSRLAARSAAWVCHALGNCHGEGIAAVLVLLSAFGVACEDTSEPQATTEPPATVTSPSSSTVTYALVRKEWIARQDKIAPELWLASRAAGVDVAPTDPSVSAMRALLAAAREPFGDPSRMIANRAVQLKGMLKEKGIVEPAPRSSSNCCCIPRGPAENMRSFEGFGAMCHRCRCCTSQASPATSARRIHNENSSRCSDGSVRSLVSADRPAKVVKSAGELLRTKERSGPSSSSPSPSSI